MVSADLAALQVLLSGLKRDGYDRRPEMPFGVPAIDGALVDGGLRLNALHEVAAASPNLDDDIATTLFIAGLAARCWGPVLWVANRQDLFAPDLARVGLADSRLIRVEATGDAAVARLMEEGLLHRGLGAVIGEVGRMTLAASTRLLAAAAGGQTIALLHRRHEAAGADPLAVASSAVTRWRIGAARRLWRVELAHQDGGGSFAAQVRACDSNGRLAEVPRPVDRRVGVREYERVAA